ncbi:MAG: MoaD/ThiS family protein [Candidatus Anammoxibacter sp.]
MPVTVRVPTPLRSFTNGAEEVAIEGNTIQEIVDNLEASHNGIKERLCGEDGKIRRFLNVYVNDEDIRFLQNQDTAVKDGDTVSIVPAIAGG